MGNFVFHNLIRTVSIAPGGFAPAAVAERRSVSVVPEHGGASTGSPGTDVPPAAAAGPGPTRGYLSHRPAASPAPARGIHPAGPPVPSAATTTAIRGTTVR